MKNSYLILIAKQAINYFKFQLIKVEEDHDWTYGMKIKIQGSKNETNWMDLTKYQYYEIKKIIIGKK